MKRPGVRIIGVEDQVQREETARYRGMSAIMKGNSNRKE